MKPGTLQYINKKFENYHITKHTFDLTDKPTFFVYDLTYNKIFGKFQLTLDLDDV